MPSTLDYETPPPPPEEFPARLLILVLLCFVPFVTCLIIPMLPASIERSYTLLVIVALNFANALFVLIRSFREYRRDSRWHWFAAIPFALGLVSFIVVILIIAAYFF